MLASLMSLLTDSTSVPLKITLVPLMTILFPAINVGLELAPCTVGQAVFQSLLPNNTQVLYSSLNAVLLVSAAVGPPRL